MKGGRRTAVVTGSTGFVGRALCHRLLADGWRVRGAARSRHVPDLIEAGLEPAPEVAAWLFGGGPVPDPVRAVLAEAELVVHLAGDPTYGSGDHYRRVNLEPVRRLADALVDVAVPPRVVFASSIGAQDRSLDDAPGDLLDEEATAAPSSDYGRSKLEAEDVLTASGLPVRIARLGMVVGAEMRPNSHVAVLARQAAVLPAVLEPLLVGTMPLVHVDDAAAALDLLGRPDTPDGTYLIVADNVPAGDIVARLRGRDRARPPGDARRADLLPAAVRSALPFGVRSVLSPELAFDSARLRALGWRPSVDWRRAVDEVALADAARRRVDLAPDGWTIVTGAASGLGRELARSFARRDRRLLLIDRDEAGLAAVLEELGAERHRSLVVDLRDPGAAAAVLDDANRDGGRIAELVLGAGVGRKGAVGTVETDAELAAVDVNLRARIALVNEVLPEMVARHRGRIVLVSSSSAFQPLPGFATYGAANAGLLAFGESLAGELAGSGVQVLTVCPGGMDTAFQATAGVRRVEGEALLSPGAVAERILVALDRHRTPLVVGRTARAMDLMARVTPRPVQRALWRRLVDARR